MQPPIPAAQGQVNQRDFGTIMSYKPRGFSSVLFSRAPSETPLIQRATDVLNETFSHPGKLSWWDKTVGSPYHLAQRYPAFKPVFTSAQNFTNDELFYYIRNPRTNRIYGMSYVEQIFLIINIALRHENRLLAEFTESNVPAAFMVMPEEATLEQIKTFTAWLDAKLSGNVAQRSKIVPIPGGGTAGDKIIPMK